MRPLLTIFLVFIWTVYAGAAPIPGTKDAPSEIVPRSQEPRETQRIECPKKTDPSALGLKAPSNADYLKLVEAISAEYGEKASRYCGQIDAVLQRTTAPGDGADLGAIFQGLGAGPAAVYATAWSAKKNPDDPLTANLGITGAGVGAKIGGAITIQGDNVTNVAGEAEVSGQVGITGATLTGRLALEGGPDISTSWGNTIGLGCIGIDL